MQIPGVVCTVVGEVIGAYYYNHRRIEMLFLESGAPGEPPEGNCRDKSIAWLKRTSSDPTVDALAVLGAVLEEFMEVEPALSYPSQDQELERQRKRVTQILVRNGMAYRSGGVVCRSSAAAPTRTLEMILKQRNLAALDEEFVRALRNLDSDPPAAVTSACAIIEALCKVYIEDEHLQLPSDQTIKPLWKTVQVDLGLEPSVVADDDLKRILGGLSSVVDGLGAFRTHVGSAHGRGRSRYRPVARHARLAVHAAYSLTTFVLETWEARKTSDAS